MRKILLYSLLLLAPFISKAQYRFDWGFGLGAANYLGDIGGKDKPRRDFIADIKLPATRWSGSIFMRQKFSPTLAGKLEFNYLRIDGADSLSTYGPRRGRNLSFRNDMFELSGHMELYIYRLNDVGRTGMYRNDFQLYLFGGVGGVYSNPKAELGGKWYALQPLRTEGEAKPYSKLQLVIPAGIGFYYTINRKYRLGMELGWRTTFTDYLDDISTTYADPSKLPNATAVALANRSNAAYAKNPEGLPQRFNYIPGSLRGDPTHNDSYLTANINFSFVIRGRSRFYRARYGFLHGRHGIRRRKSRAKF